MKFRLTAPHYIDDILWPDGTEIGDDTDVPYDGPPSMNMVGLDEKSQKAVLKQRGLGTRPVESLPMTVGAEAKAPIFPKKVSDALKIRETRPDEPIAP